MSKEKLRKTQYSKKHRLNVAKADVIELVFEAYDLGKAGVTIRWLEDWLRIKLEDLPMATIKDLEQEYKGWL